MTHSISQRRGGFAGIAHHFRQDSRKGSLKCIKERKVHCRAVAQAHMRWSLLRSWPSVPAKSTNSSSREDAAAGPPSPGAEEISDHGRPRVWRCPASNHSLGRSNWIFGFFTGFSWKTTFSVQRLQIWTVWENSQMAARWKFGGEKNSSGILEAC